MTTTDVISEVPGRQPCPCGSGKRYKQCHGRAARHAATERTMRPFRGLAAEVEWVAMREFVPAATAAQVTTDGTAVVVCTSLPMAMAALRRQDGTVLLGLQCHGGSGDPSRDAAAALQAAVDSEPGTPVPARASAPGMPRLQDVLAADHPFQVSTHASYTFWVSAGAAQQDQINHDALKKADDAMIPTRRLGGVDAAYWCTIAGRGYLRWVLDGDEEPTLDALARLHARGGSGLGEGTKYVGAFRTCGLLVPVWDLPDDTDAGDLETPAAAFRSRLAEAMTSTEPLTGQERRARAGVVGRQLTLR